MSFMGGSRALHYTYTPLSRDRPLPPTLANYTYCIHIHKYILVHVVILALLFTHPLRSPWYFFSRVSHAAPAVATATGTHWWIIIELEQVRKTEE